MPDLDKKSRYIDELVKSLNDSGYSIPDEVVDSAKKRFVTEELSYDDFKNSVNSSTKGLLKELKRQKNILDRQKTYYNSNDYDYSEEKFDTLNVDDLSYNELDNLLYHYSLKKDAASTYHNGLTASVGRNSKGIDEFKAIYFSKGVEGVLELWDSWLKWRLNRLYNPDYQEESSEIVEKRDNNIELSESEKEKFYHKKEEWDRIFLNKEYLNDPIKLNFLFQYQLDEMLASNYYNLELIEGAEYREDEIDVKKEATFKRIAESNDSDNNELRYHREKYGTYSSEDSVTVDKWNMNTILNKEVNVQSNRIKKLVLSDGSDNVYSIVNSFYNKYKSNVPEEKQVKFDILDRYMTYCSNKMGNNTNKSAFNNMFDTPKQINTDSKQTTLQAQPKQMVLNKPNTSISNNAGYISIILVSLLFSLLFGIILLLGD